jgi:hypothetical protein
MNPIECLQEASAKFKRHYSLPLDKHGPLHNDNADWTTATQSRYVFRAHIAHLMIPHYLSNIIWEALTDVPNIEAGRTRLQEVFTQPTSYDDYLNAIQSRKKYAASGMTGFSFRHLKTLPEIYTRPRTTCSAHYGPLSTYRTSGDNACSSRYSKHPISTI